jgi:hypothetical protein
MNWPPYSWRTKRDWDFSIFCAEKIEQVRKGGLPPLAEQRGQAPLPDLFYSEARKEIL